MSDNNEGASHTGNRNAVEDAENYEEENVHTVYEQIATHFSSTRYKPWPITSSFLASLPPGSIGLDIGCGNGKNLPQTRNDIFILATDRSEALCRIAAQAQRTHHHHQQTSRQSHQTPQPTDNQTNNQDQPKNTSVLLPPAPHSIAGTADLLSLPHPEGKFDFAISIAVLHHLSTPARRRAATSSILSTLLPHTGRALLYVWALEQESSRRGWKEGGEQDVMVPWVRKAPKAQGGEETFHRYYHLYRQGELEGDVVAAGGRVVEGGYEKDNWWVIASIES